MNCTELRHRGGTGGNGFSHQRAVRSQDVIKYFSKRERNLRGFISDFLPVALEPKELLKVFLQNPKSARWFDVPTHTHTHPCGQDKQAQGTVPAGVATSFFGNRDVTKRFLTTAPNECKSLASRPGRFTHQKEPAVAIWAGCKVPVDIMHESAGNRNNIPTAQSLVTVLTELPRFFSKTGDF